MRLKRRRLLGLGVADRIFRLAAFAAVALLAGPPPAFSQGSAADRVRFPTATPGQSLELSGYLYRPSGSGPSPAMVLLLSCGGLAPYNLAYGEWFSKMGYVAVVVDSFAPRHQTNVCGVGRNPSLADVVGDALGALAYLRQQPAVDGARVGVIGWSYGARAALILSSRSFIETAQPPGGGFRAAVSLYPWCDAPHGRSLAADTSIPLLLLLGGADNWALAAPCERWAEGLKQAGHVVEWHTYPGVHHAFDNDGFGERTVTALGRYTMKYDPFAAADAHTRILVFLTKYLRGP